MTLASKVYLVKLTAGWSWLNTKQRGVTPIFVAKT
jgi:hypothetical protein